MERNYYIDFLKVAATVVIFFHHFTQLICNGNGFFFNGPIYFGRLVELFFIISGYLMYKYQTRIINGEKFRKYFYNRAVRFIPLTFIAAVSYDVLAILYKVKTGQPFLESNLSLSGTLFTAINIQAGWMLQNPGINNPTWYISVLMLCYLILFVLNKAAHKCNINVNYLYIIMILIGIGVIEYSIEMPFFNAYSARGYYSFFAVSFWQTL